MWNLGRVSSSSRHGRLVAAGQKLGHRRGRLDGTVTLIEMCSGAVGFRALAMDQLGVVDISGGSVERGNLTPGREAFSHFGSPLSRAEPVPSRPKVSGDAAERGQEPLRVPG